jgi:hypothetical protein
MMAAKIERSIKDSSDQTLTTSRRAAEIAALELERRARNLLQRFLREERQKGQEQTHREKSANGTNKTMQHESIRAEAGQKQQEGQKSKVADSNGLTVGIA